jgi:hypothetical protein
MIRLVILAVSALACGCATHRARRSTDVDMGPVTLFPAAARALNPTMERYFTETLAAAEDRTSAVFQSLGYRCDHWIPIVAMQSGNVRGVFGHSGLAPKDWSGQTYCRPAAAGDELTVTVSLASESVELNARQGETALDNGTDFILFHRFGCDQHLTLAAGAMRSSTERPLSGERLQLARPRAMEVSVATHSPGHEICSKEEPIPSELQVIRRIDPRLLVAFLEGLPQPPKIELRAPSSANASPPTETERSTARQEIYEVILERITGRAKQLVIQEKMPPQALALDSFERVWPDVDRTALEDFNARNAKAAAFPADLRWRVPIQIVSAEQASEIFSHRDAWQRFYRAFPGSNGLISVSSVGLSRELTQAIVVVTRGADPLAGAGELFVFQRDARGWHTLYEQLLWVS